MFYKEVHPPASHKACAPPFATHKASSQGGIKSTDPYQLKLRWPIDESSNRIDSPIPRFTGSKKLPPTLILERTGGESKQGDINCTFAGKLPIQQHIVLSFVSLWQKFTCASYFFRRFFSLAEKRPVLIKRSRGGGLPSSE
jgi:hypothetical protein